MAERCSPGARLHGNWSPLEPRARPLAAGGVHVKGGLGWHPECGEVAGKLKGAVRRRGARVSGGGPDPGGERASCARPDAAARGGRGPEARPPRCGRPGCPSHSGTDAATGRSLCTSGLVSCTRYVLPTSRRPSRAADTAARGAQWPPSLVPAIDTSLSNLQLDSRVGHSRRALGAAASTWSGHSGARGGMEPGRAHAFPRGAPRGTRASETLALHCPRGVSPEPAAGSGAPGKVDSSLSRPRFPVKVRETHLGVSPAAQGHGT